MKKGYLMVVLHAHLPFVRHPEYDSFLEERWFFEAITETYIPLIQVFNRLQQDQVPFQVTMTISPTLATMLLDPCLQDRYLQHLGKLIELSQKEIQRTCHDPSFAKLALHYHDHFVLCREIFRNRYQGNLITAFRNLQDSGNLEIITCGATHGFLPLMRVAPASVRAQIGVACDDYEATFGRRPRGIWLPECGYYPGDDKVLKEDGLQYFFVDTHGVLFAKPRPKYGVYAPLYCPGSGVAAFARDLESSKQVWSAEEGYPGDFWYREFYRDIGYDLDWNYIRPYIDGAGVRVDTGMKYYRITSKTNHKEPYDPDRARQKAEEHAGNFMFNREKQVEHLFNRMGRRPVIVAPYDAELYGHWWYEGPQFLDFLFRKIAFDSEAVELVTAPRYLEENPKNQPSTPCYSSWGYKGYSEVWLEGTNDWVYRHLHAASNTMREFARTYPEATGIHRRSLNQMARELLLAEASDWAFMMKNGTSMEYAVRRTREHLLAFLNLARSIQTHSIHEGKLSELETKNCIFPRINYKIYA